MKNITFLFLLALLALSLPSQAAYYRHVAPAIQVADTTVVTTMPVSESHVGSGWQSIVSFSASILGLAVAALPFGLTALIFGIIGVSGRKKLKGLGVAGIIIGAVDIIVGLLVIAAAAAGGV